MTTHDLAMRRFCQSAGTVALALLIMFTAAGVASAKFVSQPADAALTASTLKLEPPTVLLMSCQPSLLNNYPVVTFTPTASKNVVATRPVKNPAQVLGYTWSFTNTGAFNNSRNGTLTAADTSWSGPGHLLPVSWTFTIATTYAGWTSLPATLTFHC